MNNVTSILRKMGQILEIFANGLKILEDFNTCHSREAENGIN